MKVEAMNIIREYVITKMTRSLTPNLNPANHLPNVSKMLKLKMKMSIVQDNIWFYIPLMNSRSVFVITAGNTVNVTMNTEHSAVRCFQAILKLFFNIFM